jgi:hypothetical protein
MTAVLKSRAKESPGAELFGQLSALFSSPKVPTTHRVSAELKKSLSRLHGRVSLEELIALRETVRSLALLIDKIEADSSGSAPDLETANLTAAHKEDEIAARALRKVQPHSHDTMSTAESVREGDALIAQARAMSNATVASRISKGEFFTSGELQRLLDIKRASISSAVRAGRMFAVVGPSGDNYYPAYFADEGLDRRALEKVSKTLGALPALSKHHFFTSRSTLLKATPLAALRKGRVSEVLTAAAAFAER